MKTQFRINYNTRFGEQIYLSGNIAPLGGWDEKKAVPMTYTDDSAWELALDLDAGDIEYLYLIKEGDRVLRKEWGSPREIHLTGERSFFLNDQWSDVPSQKFLYTSAFTSSFFKPGIFKPALKYLKKSVLLFLNCPFVSKDQEVILSGESDYLGNWNAEKALTLNPVSCGRYALVLNAKNLSGGLQYKFAIREKATGNVVHWEEGQNRSMYLLPDAGADSVQSFEVDYRRAWMNWKAAGLAVPVFSLRSEDSFGIGEFSDLKKMVDWAKNTGMQLIQILPVNDTTITRKWTDSYPYNSISIYALHPVYLGMHEFPLRNKTKFAGYVQMGKELNALSVVDYERVLALKEAYLKDLFEESAAKVLKSTDYLNFYKGNEAWLFPYACFCYLRDFYQTSDHTLWKVFERYDKKALQKAVEVDPAMKTSVDMTCFTQYLLHTQLLSVKEYAHKNSVILKGDIPIGISRNSVEAWVEPHLFNLDTQTGAPPDDFSVFGQNWGFPTYNWDEMAKDGYDWWIRRFRKMADYFDAYRIDHILGFFRIWEIPRHAVQGLLGYFSPALPFSVEELNSWGFPLDEYRMTRPYIHEHFLHEFFGEQVPDIIANYLNPVSWQRYELKEFCNTQQKIKSHFEKQAGKMSERVRDGLYGLCNEVLFVADKREPNKFHPRITAQYTYSYRDLDDRLKNVFNRLYNHFFYERHNEFWKNQAMQKLPALISATDMLVCGEDLGMIPDCVPAVMKELQILSLEIQRMPKDSRKKFEDMGSIPYMSVCTTSTHDLSPIRLWWQEDRAVTQQYYNEVLWKHGAAPEDCTPEICRQIVINHLNAPAMLTVLPLQDWLSIDGDLRRGDPSEERINVPAVAQHYWQYRMHLTLENLLQSRELSRKVAELLRHSGRYNY